MSEIDKRRAEYIKRYKVFVAAAERRDKDIDKYKKLLAEAAVEYVLAMRHDDYIDVIKMHYLHDAKFEDIARATYSDMSTVFRQRKRMIFNMAALLFPEEVE